MKRDWICTRSSVWLLISSRYLENTKAQNMENLKPQVFMQWDSENLKVQSGCIFASEKAKDSVPISPSGPQTAVNMSWIINTVASYTCLAPCPSAVNSFLILWWSRDQNPTNSVRSCLFWMHPAGEMVSCTLCLCSEKAAYLLGTEDELKVRSLWMSKKLQSRD